MDTLLSHLRSIADRYALRDIYVFGSRAEEVSARFRGETPASAAPASDVDIAVQPPRETRLTAQDRVEIAVALEDLLGVPRVDLVVLSEARPFLALDVIRGELLQTSDPHAQAEHELYIMRRAADLAHLQRERVREILSGGAR